MNGMPPRPPARRGRALERPLPDADQVAALPAFPSLHLDAIELVADADAARAARAALAQEPVLGFDTESRPTFHRDQTSDGPHLIQFATAHRAWLLPVHIPENVALVVDLLQAAEVVKVGFGLSGDTTLLHHKFGARLDGVVDLNARFRELGFRRAMGVKMAVAIVLGQNFPKSKRISTSDWSHWPLSDGQKVYAANDACAAMRVQLGLAAGALRQD